MSEKENLIEVVPQQYGEAIRMYPTLHCEDSEWDNRTTMENAAYLIGWLRSELASLKAENHKLTEELERVEIYKKNTESHLKRLEADLRHYRNTLVFSQPVQLVAVENGNVIPEVNVARAQELVEAVMSLKAEVERVKEDFNAVKRMYIEHMAENAVKRLKDAGITP